MPGERGNEGGRERESSLYRYVKRSTDGACMPRQRHTGNDCTSLNPNNNIIIYSHALTVFLSYCAPFTGVMTFDIHKLETFVGMSHVL